jgi:hypothetical protein
VSRFAWFAALVLGLVLIAGQASHAAVSKTIYAWFDVDGGLNFRYADSSNVGSTVPPGTYTVNLNNNTADDYAVDHRFHLFGPGVDYTNPPGSVQTTFTVTFQAGGTYTIQDDLDPKNIHQTIVATTGVGSNPPSPTSTTPTSTTKKPTSSDITGSAVLPFRGALDATVYKSGKLALNRSGKAVSQIKQGRYTFSVDDESKLAGFTLKSLRGNPVTITSKVFVGAHNVTLTLKQGRWFYYSPGGKQLQFIVLS